ncbi:syndecan-4 isoform X2 [Antennarius striatus]|uniref:syndecan-4 isoform X2 n=1 Tax=Antennarius striatus TaxID=241820 RepID=UPI0035B02995
MLKQLCIVLLLSASAAPESVREMETWMPMRSSQEAALLTRRDDLEASGSDFGFTNDGEEDEDDEDYYTDTLYDDEDSYDYFSGSGDGVATVTSPPPPRRPDINDNKIPEVAAPPAWPTVDDADAVRNANEIPPPRKEATPSGEQPSNVLMAHASEDSIFSKTEVLAALIAGGAVGLMFAVLLILLLIYCMKKKDEGSYDLGKKPIYKKAPTTEIYA